MIGNSYMFVFVMNCTDVSPYFFVSYFLKKKLTVLKHLSTFQLLVLDFQPTGFGSFSLPTCFPATAGGFICFSWKGTPTMIFFSKPYQTATKDWRSLQSLVVSRGQSPAFNPFDCHVFLPDPFYTSPDFLIFLLESYLMGMDRQLLSAVRNPL